MILNGIPVIRQIVVAIMKILHLNLKKKWFDEIKSGEKTVELRRVSDYWRKRLIGRHYDENHIKCGYPKRSDTSKILRRKWRCVARETLLHPEFGPESVNEPVKHHDEYVGKRVKRGMFKSKDGTLINSDVNGAINIARKSKVTSMEITPEMIKGIVAFPKRIRVANV